MSALAFSVILLAVLVLGVLLGAWWAALWLSRPEAIQWAWDDGYAAGFRVAQGEDNQAARSRLDRPDPVRLPARISDVGTVAEYESDVAEAQGAYDLCPSGRAAQELLDAKAALEWRRQREGLSVR